MRHHPRRYRGRGAPADAGRNGWGHVRHASGTNAPTTVNTEPPVDCMFYRYNQAVDRCTLGYRIDRRFDACFALFYCILLQIGPLPVAQ
eukprot:gene391-biopygen10623